MKMLKDYADYEFRGSLKYWRTKCVSIFRIIIIIIFFFYFLDFLKIDFSALKYQDINFFWYVMKI